MLFARLRADERASWFLGPATYVKHEREAPMAITWRLKHPCRAICSSNSPPRCVRAREADDYFSLGLRLGRPGQPSCSCAIRLITSSWRTRICVARLPISVRNSLRRPSPCSAISCRRVPP